MNEGKVCFTSLGHGPKNLGSKTLVSKLHFGIERDSTLDPTWKVAFSN